MKRQIFKHLEPQQQPREGAAPRFPLKVELQPTERLKRRRRIKHRHDPFLEMEVVDKQSDRAPKRRHDRHVQTPRRAPKPSLGIALGIARPPPFAAAAAPTNVLCAERLHHGPRHRAHKHHHQHLQVGHDDPRDAARIAVELPSLNLVATEHSACRHLPKQTGHRMQRLTKHKKHEPMVTGSKMHDFQSKQLKQAKYTNHGIFHVMNQTRQYL